jgi:putative peptidoglycan lipid II flippase
MGIQHVARAAIIIAVLAFGSRILGLLREVVFAAFLGISADMDSFLIAQIIPTTLGGMFYASLLTAMIPAYSDALAKNGREGELFLAKALFSTILPLTLIASVILYITAPYIIVIIGHGLSTYGKDLATAEMRVMLPCLSLMCLLAIANAYQQANHKFLFPYLGPVIFNIAIISGFYAFGSGIDTYKVSIIITAATLFQLIIQYPGLLIIEFKIKLPKVSLHKFPKLPREFVALFIPAVLVTMLNDLMPIMDRVLASTLADGGVSAINYAHRVNSLVVSLIAGSIAAATYPSIAGSLSRGNNAEVFDSLEQTIRLIAFATFPAIGLILLFPHELIEMLFMRGAFDSTAVLSTGSALYYLSFGMFSTGLISVFGQYNCVLKRNKLLVQTTCIIFVCKILFSLLLIRIMSLDGLAIGTSLSVIAGSTVFFWAWYRDYSNKGGDLKLLIYKIAFIIIAAIIAVIAAKIAYFGLKHFINDGRIILLLSWIAGGLAYVFSAQRLGCEELLWFKKSLLGKMKASSNLH